MPPRTKACALCRKQRIKCDATLPQCLMCIRLGRECPGPVSGPLIIDMTSSASKLPRKKSPSKALAKQNLSAQSFPMLPAEVLLNLSLGAQISQREVIHEAFYANFMQFFTSDGEGRDIQNKLSWLHQLPSLVSDGTNIALALAVRATASAFCGVESSNPALLQEAVSVYGQALSMHARLIREKPKEVTVHMVGTSVMLSLFEAMQATTADAYREHVQGAARMIEVSGIGQCQQGVLCQLFFHVRTQMAFVYLTTGQGKRLNVRKILTQTLGYQRLPIFQRLMSQVAVLAEMYVSLRESPKGEVVELVEEEGLREGESRESEKVKEQVIDLETYERVRLEVDALWLEYQTVAEMRGELVSWEEGGQTVYRDAFTALCVAYFSTARILFTILGPHIMASYPSLTDHYAIILSSASFLRTRKIGCAYMRMASPIFLVAMHSPHTEQRREATNIFEEWQKGSMAGISALALETIYRRQGLDAGVEIPPPKDRVPIRGSWDSIPPDMFDFGAWMREGPDPQRGNDGSFSTQECC